MIYIPDLFSAYAKGQEEAIDRNWNDLNQYETVEQARTNNDMARINLQAGMDDYGNNRAISNALGSQAMIGEDLLKRMYPGDAANADMNTQNAISQLGAFNNNLPGIDNLNNAKLTSNIITGTNAADTAAGISATQRQYLPQTLGVLGESIVAQNLVTGQNAANAPIANAAAINSNTQAGILNDATVATGIAQNAYTQQLLPETFALQKATIQQQLDTLKRLPVEQQQLQKQRIAETLNMLRQNIAQAAAMITNLQQQAQMNPANASPINSEILRYRAMIAGYQQTIQQTEAALGTASANTVQSLMGN